MKKIIYIIPGFGEQCTLLRYQNLGKAFELKGYSVHYVNPIWHKPVSEQIFQVKKNDVIFGFSLGAIFAYIVAKKHPCRKVILASMSPINTISFKRFEKFFRKYMVKEQSTAVAKDLKNIKVLLKKLKTPYSTIVGELEKSPKDEITYDIVVPKTGHRITNKYIKYIQSLIS